jgi:hypothetical protein
MEMWKLLFARQESCSRTGTESKEHYRCPVSFGCCRCCCFYQCNLTRFSQLFVTFWGLQENVRFVSWMIAFLSIWTYLVLWGPNL